MVRKCRINREQIFELAKEIAFNGQLPTALKIKAKLSTGSMVTIQKYLQEWKKSCFKNINLDPNHNIDLNKNELLEKFHILEQNLNRQINKNEHYAQELINAEKVNISLKEGNRQLQILNQELQLRINKAEATIDTLDKVTQKIQNELDLNTNQTIKKMQQTIDNLTLELKTVNETSIAALRDTSNKGHEALMQERVVSINLQAKIDVLTKELLESKKQLNEATMTARVQNRSLTRQNEELQKIIQEHGLDKSPQLEEGACLQFVNGAAVYGK